MRSLRLGSQSLLIVALALTLVSCTSASPPAPTSTSTPSSVPTAEPVSDSPLTCGNVVSTAAAAAALTGADGVAPAVVEALQPSYAAELVEITGAGGLACSWRVGEGQNRIGDEQGNWAYLTVEILPHANNQWVAPYAGDTPSEEHRLVSRLEATTAAGEAGWLISAAVGSAWVEVTVRSSGVISGGSRFDGMSDRVLDGMMPAAESTFAAVQAATPGQMSWPKLPFREGESQCDGGVAQAGIASALQLGSTPGVYTLRDARVDGIYGLSDAVNARIGAFDCELYTEGYGYAEITVLRDFASSIDTLGSAPDISSALEPVVLEGAVDGEKALQAIREDGPSAPLYFTVGQTLYIVESDGPVAVAEAIIAQTR